MIKTITFGLLFLVSPITVLATPDCSTLKGCAKKFCEIERQLEIANQQNNRHKANGLQKALEESKANCTTEGLIHDLVQKINEAKEDIVEYETDLKEAQENGKENKTRKYKIKITEEHKKLESYEIELSYLE